MRRALLVVFLLALLCIRSYPQSSSGGGTIAGGGSVAGSHPVTLTWAASGSSVAGYNIYRATVSGGPYTKLNSVLITGITYTDATIVAGQTYYYVATAVTSGGTESAYSNEASAPVPSP